MRKEIIIAIIIGVSIGLIVAFGVKTARYSLNNRPQASPTPLTGLTSTDTATDHSILITSPEPDEIVDKELVKVIGTTTPESMVTVVSLDDEDAVAADNSGAFTATVKASGGPNPISVTSFSPSGNEATVNFTIVFSTSDLDSSPSAQKETKS